MSPSPDPTATRSFSWCIRLWPLASICRKPRVFHVRPGQDFLVPALPIDPQYPRTPSAPRTAAPDCIFPCALVSAPQILAHEAAQSVRSPLRSTLWGPSRHSLQTAPRLADKTHRRTEGPCSVSAQLPSPLSCYCSSAAFALTSVSCLNRNQPTFHRSPGAITASCWP
jgi:hypothetical protein